MERNGNVYEQIHSLKDFIQANENITNEQIVEELEHILKGDIGSKKEKRKRVKTVLKKNELCNALCSNGKQCTRRKKINENYCGTHMKGCLNGTITDVMKEQDGPHNGLVIKPIEERGIVKLVGSDNELYDPEKIIYK